MGHPSRKLTADETVASRSKGSTIAGASRFSRSLAGSPAASSRFLHAFADVAIAMPSRISQATIIGDGAMGTLCALLLSRQGTVVTMWGRSAERVATLDRDRENRRYLPGHSFPESLRVTNDDRAAFSGTDLIVSAVPCQYMRGVWTGLARRVPAGVPIVSVAKGIEVGKLMRPTQIIRDCVGDVTTACLSGPNIAPEIANEKPAGVVVACENTDVAERIQLAFATSYLRVYTSRDVLGVELAGAVKNVIAIAAGIADGMDAGDNAKASLVTRGLVEITRLGLALGASADTFRGLAGVGDLITTCVSKIGRNRTAGERIGRGTSPDEVVATTPSVIEGIPTTQSVLELARQNSVNMPIVAAVGSVLFDGCSPAVAIEGLMTRRLHGE